MSFPGARFAGQGRKFGAGELEQIVKEFGYPGLTVAHMLTVFEVETDGDGFDQRGRPDILPERHVFYAELGPGPKRDRAVAENLAYKKWRPGAYPKSTDAKYEQLEKMMAIDEVAALRSASWGLGQIVGRYCGEAGYTDVREFVQANMVSEAEQLRLMLKVIKHRGLMDELVEGRWGGFARGWNGPGYKKNRYDTKLAYAFAKHSKGKVKHAKSSFSDIVSLGDQGDLVKDLQNLLVRAGFRVKPDGDFGTETKRQVRLFQLDQGLVGDGRVGPQTWLALRSAPPVEVNIDRATATVADLKDSRVIATASQAVTAAKVGAPVLASLGFADLSGGLDKAVETVEKVNILKEGLDPILTVLDLFKDNWMLLGAGALFVLYLLVKRIIDARVEDHQSGKTL